MVQLFRPQLIAGQPVEEGHGSQDVPVSLDFHLLRREHRLKKPSGGERCEAPVVAATVHVVTGDLANSRNSDERHSTRPEDPVQGPYRRTYILDAEEHLTQNDAIKNVGRDFRSRSEIRDHSGIGIPWDRVDHVALHHAISTESSRVRRVLRLEDPAADVLRMGGEESLDVVPIDWRTFPILSEATADR